MHDFPTEAIPTLQKPFLFEEFTDVPAHDDYLWANSSFAFALLLAESYSEFGWELGRAFVQDIDDLPLHMYKQNGETIFQSPAEIQLSQNACEAKWNMA